MFSDRTRRPSARDVWTLARSVSVWRGAWSVVKSFGRAKGFAAASVLAVALGIGVNSVVFSLFDRLLFRQLPYQEPSRLVQIYSERDVNGHRVLPTAVSLELAREKELFSGIAWASGGELEPMAPVPGENPLLWLTGVTTNTLDILGIRPAIGAGFSTLRPTTLERPVLLTYDVWQRRYGGSDDVLSLSWTARDAAQREVRWWIVGVLPDGFLLPSSRPASATFDGVYGFDPGFDRQPSLRSVGVAPVARLVPGVTMSVAEARIDTIVASRFPNLRDSIPGGRSDRVSLAPLQSGLSTVVRSYAWLAILGSWAVLASSCLTLALLLLTWVQSRQRDAGLRLALGASPRRIVMGTLSESVVLCVVGAVVGWIAYIWARSLFTGFLPAGLQTYAAETMDFRVLATTSALALLCAIVAGTLPAIRASCAAPLDVLRPEQSTTSVRLVGGSILLSMQAAFSLVLLVCAFATLPTAVRTLWTPPGFEATDLYIVNVPTSNDRTAGDAREQVRRGREALDIARALPGVASASLSMKDPFWPSAVEKQFLERALENREPGHFAGRILPVDWDFFATLRTPLVAGRGFSVSEIEQQALVAVVNESGSRALSPTGSVESVLGQTVTTEDGPRVIIGVVEDFLVGAETGITSSLFLPLSATAAYRQAGDNPYPWMSYGLILRMTPGRIPDITLLSDRLREQPWLPNWVGARRESVADKLGVEFGPPRLLALVFGTLGVISLLLAVVSIYGLASFEVRRRREEMTVRLALGASLGGLRRRLAFVTVRPIVVGVVAALPVSWVMMSLLARQVPAIDSGDPLIYGAATTVMLVAASVAAWTPRWRSITMRVGELLRGA